MTHRALYILAGLAAGMACAVHADAGPAPNSALVKLLALSQADQESSHQTGCVFSFFGPHDTFIQLIDGELMFRTASGRTTCRIKNDEAFMDARAAAVCKDIRFKLVMTGRTSHDEASDSSTGPARLTVTQGGMATDLRGHWGVAC